MNSQQQAREVGLRRTPERRSRCGGTGPRLPCALRYRLSCALLVASSLLLAALSIAGPVPEARRLPPLPLPKHQLTVPANPERFRFAVGGDNRTTGHGDPMPPALREICTEIGLIRPDFVMWTGDTIHGYNDTPDEAVAEYRAFR